MAVRGVPEPIALKELRAKVRTFSASVAGYRAKVKHLVDGRRALSRQATPLPPWRDQADQRPPQQSPSSEAVDSSDGSSRTEQAPETFAQLELQHEELEVADEELRAQIEELTQAGIRLELERERYEMLFDFAPDALLATDHDGNIRNANRAACALLNMDARDLRGKPLVAYMKRTARLDFQSALAKAAKGRVIELQVEVEGRSQARVPAVLRGARAHDPKQLLISIRAFAAGAVSWRTLELEGTVRDQRVLLDKERTAGESLRDESAAKDRSLALVSHELRAPMQNILSWIHVLRGGKLTPEQFEKGLQVIERNCRTQASLVENLLDLSRIISDKMEIDREPVDLSRLAALAVESASPLAGKVEMLSEIEPDVWIAGDALRLQQVLSNLLANAIRHAHGVAPVVMTLRTTGPNAEIVVKDEGDGIDGSMLDSIFEAFKQAESGRKRGLGLGLYLVRAIVTMHGGTVRAESDGLGKGAQFFVTLPRLEHSESDTL